MKRLGRTVACCLLAAGLAGCSSLGNVGSTVTGWFGPSAPKVKPAELPDFKPTASLNRAWSVDVGSSAGYVFAPGTDGVAIYAAGAEGRIVRIDPASGREVWRVEAGKPLSAGVGVGSDLVVVGTAKGELLAFRAADGQPAWSVGLSGEILSAPLVAHGMVAARGNDGKVTLLSAADGKTRWSYSRTLPALVLRQPAGMAMGERALFVGYPGGKLVALALANGAAIWEANVALPRGATELERIADVVGPLAVDGRQVCAASYQGRVACFDQNSGNAVWTREFSGMNGVDMDDGLLFAVDDHAALQSFDKLRGTSYWRQDKLRDRRLSPPLALGGQVAVGDYQGYVHLIQAEDGAFQARAATDGGGIAGQMLPLQQGLVVQTANGGVHAFRIQ